jgi:hypothetical protein
MSEIKCECTGSLAEMSCETCNPSDPRFICHHCGYPPADDEGLSQWRRNDAKAWRARALAAEAREAELRGEATALEDINAKERDRRKQAEAKLVEAIARHHRYNSGALYAFVHEHGEALLDVAEEAAKIATPGHVALRAALARLEGGG